MKFTTTCTILTLLFAASCSHAFSTPLFTPVVDNQKTAPSKKIGVEIELPDFDALFDQIQRVSPLTKLAIEGGGRNGKRGFAAIEENSKPMQIICLLVVTAIQRHTQCL
jgi:hypothetical protein